MKKLLYLGLALLTFALHGCGPTSIVVESTPAPPPPPQAPAPEVSYQSFYDALSPYGQWINNPEYGYVWMPSVAPDFTPYGSNGHWVYTDEGWTWDSDYPWGWAAFHYGRWFFEDGYGWMWIPGNQWAPAWVTWRQSADYYGWAPLGPQVSISASYGGGYNPPNHYWHFVPQQYVASPQVNNYVVNQQQNVTIIQNTTIIRNTTINNTTVNNTTIINNNVNNRVTVNNYAGGPDPAAVSRVTGTTLRPIPLRESSRPGENAGGGTFAIYRPRINQPSASGGSGTPAAAPSRVQPLNQIHPIDQTRYNNTRPVNSPGTSNTNPANPSPNGGNPAFNGNSNGNGNGNPSGNANTNGNTGNNGYPRNNGNPNNATVPNNPNIPNNANIPNNGNNPNNRTNSTNPNTTANPSAPRTVNSPAATPANNTTAPANNTTPAGRPVYTRPATNNPAPVRTQPGVARPQVSQPPTNNQTGAPKRVTPVPRPLNQAPAGNQPKKDDKDNKDKKDKPNVQR